MSETLQIIEKTQLTPLKSDDFLGDRIADFLLIKSFSLKPKSAKTYTESLNELILYFGSETDVTAITQRDLAEWLHDLSQRRSASGVFQVWQTAGFFFRWFYAADPGKNPLAAIHLKRPKRDPIAGIAPEQVQKILKTIDGANKHRDRAIISVLFASGLRKAEFCGLKLADIDIVTGAINVRTESAKRSKFRQVHITGKALLYLRRYVKTLTGDDPAAELWQTAGGKALSAAGIHEILARREADAKLPEMYDFHDYRRGCALSMHRQGADIKTISHFLGHADLKTTERYIALDDQDTAAAAIRFDPLK